jgi:hypothetical protein
LHADSVIFRLKAHGSYWRFCLQFSVSDWYEWMNSYTIINALSLLHITHSITSARRSRIHWQNYVNHSFYTYLTPNAVLRNFIFFCLDSIIRRLPYSFKYNLFN